MAVGFDGSIYVLDTANGQCWSRISRGRWRNEGNPTRLDRQPADPPLSLTLPDERVELTIEQRRSKPIPGSDDRIVIHLDDITGGQVVISVKSDDGEVLLDDVSTERGEVVTFRVGKGTYYCHVKELKNFLTGEDIAVVEVASSRKALRLSDKGESNGDRDLDKPQRD